MATTQIKYELNKNAERYVRERSMKIMLELVEELDINPADAYYCEERSNSEISETYYIVQVTKSGSRVAAKIEDYDGYAENNVVKYSEDLVDDIELELALISGCKKMFRIKPIYKNGYYLDVADISNSIDIKKIEVGSKYVTQVIKLNSDNEDNESNSMCNLLAQLEVYLFNEYGIKPCIVEAMLQFFKVIMNEPEEPYTQGSTTNYHNNLKNGNIIYYTGLSKDKEVKICAGEPTGNKEDDEITEAMLALHNLLINV